MLPKADIIYFSKEAQHPNWILGNKYHCAYSVSDIHNQLSEIVDTSDAEWVVFQDLNIGQADAQLIEELAAQPIDIWHGGLKCGVAHLPDVMNYVTPTWMYNYNAPDNVTHTNFRMSFRACMVRMSVLKKIGLPSAEFISPEMCAVAYGYQTLKQGGIIRYHEDLIQTTFSHVNIPLKDEWIFARSFFPKKWQWWAIFNKENSLRNYKVWSKLKNIKYSKLNPVLHSSVKTDESVQYARVSVLAPTLDRYPYIKEELRELNEQTILPHEVLITDQTPPDRRQELDVTQYPNLTIKYFPQDDTGQCLAWNKLMQEATGGYIFFFGDDAYDIKPDLIEKMLKTMQRFNADMVASNVREKGITYGPVNHHYYLSDTFPITLIKKSVVEKAGGMDMFFNCYAKADHDLAMRCHNNGALMIFDPSALIGHHRAPSGGLRAHKARVVTNYMTKHSATKITTPPPSEIFIYKRYYTTKQYRNHICIRYMNQVLVNGSIFKKLLSIAYFLYKLPALKKAYGKNEAIADAELKRRRLS